MAIRVVMLGPPGAGKGTQAEKLARTRGVPRISTGDILREAVQAGTPIGRAAKAAMDTGKLVGDDIMISIVRERLERRDTEEGFILEGFPRTVVQAQALDTMVDDRAPLVVIDVDVPEETLVTRLSTRLICSSCGWTSAPGANMCGRCGNALVQRIDDNAEIVRERLRVYGRESQPLVDFYERRRTFRSVDGDQAQDAVAADISAALASALGGRP